MSTLDQVAQQADLLSPDDRLRLIARLWESLPADHWASPSSAELVQLKRRLGQASERSVTPFVPNLWTRYFAKGAPGSEHLYAAPRRFDLATVFAVTVAYSLLFTSLTLLDFGPVARLLVGAFVTIVGLGQPLLETRFNARASSVIVGSAAISVAILVWAVYFGVNFLAIAFYVAFFGLLIGAPSGYLAGAMVGGVFLVADLLRKRFQSSERAAEPASMEIDADE